MNKYFLFFLILIQLVVAGSACASDFFVRNYLSGVTLNKHQLEFSADYLVMNDTVDLLDIKESRMSSVSSTFSGDSIGDLKGGQLLVAYGLSDEWLLSGGYVYRDLDVTVSNFEIDSYELALTKRFNLDETDSLYAFLVLGGRYDTSTDFSTSNVAEIDYFAKKLGGNYSVSEKPGRIEISDGNITLSSPIVNRDGSLKQPLTLSMQDSTDYSVFIRGGVGKRWQQVNLSLFAEVGYSDIQGDFDQNLDLYGVDSDNNLVATLDQGLDRDENYAKAGFDLYYETGFGVAANLSYSYIVLDRDEGLNDFDTNHVVEGDLILWLNRHLALDVGAAYYSRQFNGVVPLLYNKYTQSSFDHDYGVVHCGLIVNLGR